MNRIGLEAQVVRELEPDDVVRAAGAAGFDMAGVYIDLDRWTPAMTREVCNAFAQTGVAPLEAEVIRMGEAVGERERRLIDIASDIGLPYLIVVSMARDGDRAADLLAELAGMARPSGVRPVLEFGAFTAIRDVDAALAAVSRAGGGVDILPDPIHLARSGGAPADLKRIPAAILPFAQICDAGPPPANLTPELLLEEARHYRLDIGEGQLPLGDFYRALPPGIPLSNEVRSIAWERRYPDPFERARILAANMRRWLASIDMR
ncbi:MAG: sugar phosphate isomerase/epimerase family protein [Sphingobium phenoxybenzoativorans]